MDWAAFFEIHKNLPREGPGSAAEVDWAVGLAELPARATICDLGCGPGGDIPALLEAAGTARVIGIDWMEEFIATARSRYGADPRVTLRKGDMAKVAHEPEAPFDMIWCAGALYFLGLSKGLKVMKSALRPGGILAFSEPCFFVDDPSPLARGFWEGYPAGSEASIGAAVGQAGFSVLGTRKLGDEGWEAYYQPMEERIAGLQHTDDIALRAACDDTASEAALWRQVRGETGYLLTVARA